MKKLLFYAASLVLFVQAVQAQSIKDGLRHLELEQFQSARKVFNGLVSKAPTAEHYYYLGYFHLQDEHPDSAKMFFEKGIVADKKFALNHAGLGKVLLFNGDKVAAKKQFDDAIALTKGKNMEVIFRVAEAYIDYEVKDPDQAITLLESVKTRKEFTPEMYVVLGDAYNEKNNISKARENYLQADHFTGKNSPKVITRSANSLIRVKNYAGAVESLKKAISIDPNYSPAYRRLADVYYLYQKYPLAIENLKKYISLADDDPETRFRYAKALFNNQDYKTALEELNKLDGKISNKVILARLKAYCQTEVNECENAKKNIDIFFAGAKKEQIIPSDYEYLGKIYLCLNQESDALENFKKAATMDTSSNGLLVRKRVADTLSARKRYSEAVLEYNQILQKTPPKDANAMLKALYNSAITYYYNKDYKPADSLLAKILEISPNYAQGYLLRGRSNANLEGDKMTGRAKPHYESYLKVTEELIAKAKEGDKEKEIDRYKSGVKESYKYLMSNAYIVDKNLAKSKEYAKKVLELDPKDSQALIITKAQSIAPVANTNTTPKKNK